MAASTAAALSFANLAASRSSLLSSARPFKANISGTAKVDTPFTVRSCNGLQSDKQFMCNPLNKLRMFERLPKQNVVIWTAMIGGCAHHNEYRMAIQYFEDMQHAGLKPDGQTFMCLLTACNHVGLAEDCHLHLISMTSKHGVAPTVDHFNCVVDILGRAGRVEEAKDLLETKTHADNIVGWMSLLSHCKTYGKIQEGNQCLEHIMAFDRKHAAGYTLMSKVYESAGMRENAEMLLVLRDSANAWKKPGEAFIELENQVHGFFVGEKTHPQIHEIHQKLQKLHMQMQERGFIF